MRAEKTLFNRIFTENRL